MLETSLLPNIITFLSTIHPFDLLSKHDQQALAGVVDILYLTKDQTLEQQQLVGKGLFIIRSGAVEQRLPSGELRARLTDEDLFGFSQLNQEGSGDYHVIAIENTLLYRIPRSKLFELIENNPAIRHHFAAKESVRLAHSTTHLAEEAIYLKTVETVMNRQMAIVSPNCSIQDTAKIMVKMHRSSALIMQDDKLLGIISDRDITKRVVAEGITIDQPISLVMTKEPQVINKSALLIEAVEMMMQHNVRSLPVVEENNVIGVLTATSLVEKSKVQAVFLISRIYRQESLEELLALVPQKQAVFLTLQEAGTDAQIIQQMLTLIADAFTKRLLQLAEREFGPAPMPYAWFAIGSQARQEMHLNSDQDSGLILARQPTSEEQDYFQRLSNFVCSGLNACGYPYCEGNMMANQAKWSVSLAKWKEYYRQWVYNPDPQALLDISVYLDIRFLFGDESLVESLQHTILMHIKGNNRFLALLIANSLRINPPLGMFRQFVLAKNGANQKVLNIKRQAVNLIVELARVYALAANNLATNTVERLKIASKQGIISQESQQELYETFSFINQVRLCHQQQAVLQDKSLTNEIEPTSLTSFERNHLKDAFRIIARYQEAAQLRFNAKGLLR
ncbi:DUF294 nucleotidyltransferase-like domain-containing protein [Gallibacterium trehalosifermentans]|uniref:DUF294 nucleotidyltransferase-like domain-containing protein n=1 Tax=Gallibacterium trehalosifermentans TaxID=516935 RepID=A0ABV6H354_9PAST